MKKRDTLQGYEKSEITFYISSIWFVNHNQTKEEKIIHLSTEGSICTGVNLKQMSTMTHLKDI